MHSRLVGALSVLDNILLGFYGHRSPGLLPALLQRGRLQRELRRLTERWCPSSRRPWSAASLIGRRIS